MRLSTDCVATYLAVLHTEVNFCCFTVYVYILAVNGTVAAVLPTNMSNGGAVIGAVVAVIGFLLLIGTAIVVVIAIVLR